VNLVTSFIMLPVLFSVTEPGRKMMKAGGNHAKQLMDIVIYSVKHNKIRPYIILSGIVNGAGIIGVWAYLLYYGQLGLSVAYNGVFHACLGFASGIGAAIAYKAEKKFGGRISLSFLFIMALGFCMFGGFKSYFVIPFAFVNGFIWNMSYPIILDLMNKQVRSEMRATVISVSSMARSVVFVVFSPLFGWVTDKYSLSAAFFWLAALFTVVTAWSLFSLARAKEL
jgi:predicted MFS family arabinose efflux permease